MRDWIRSKVVHVVYGGGTRFLDDVDDFDLVRHRYLHIHDLVHRNCTYFVTSVPL